MTRLRAFRGSLGKGVVLGRVWSWRVGAAPGLRRLLAEFNLPWPRVGPYRRWVGIGVVLVASPV